MEVSRNDLSCVEWDVKPLHYYYYCPYTSVGLINFRTVLPVAEGIFVRLRLRRLVTVVFGALFINRLTYLVP